MFASKPPEGGGIPAMAWGIAGLAVVAVVVLLVVLGRHKAVVPTTLQPLAAYAANLPLSQFGDERIDESVGGEVDVCRWADQERGARR